MIVFAAITPHSPLLLPSIGKEHQKKLAKTLEAYKMLEQDFYPSRPDVVVVISPHGAILPDAFAFSVSPIHRANLKEFGDLTTALEFKTDLKLLTALRRLYRENDSPPFSPCGGSPIGGQGGARGGYSDIPFTTITEEFCDYGTIVPLYFLSQHAPNIRLVSLLSSHLPINSHFEAGKKIGEVLRQTSARVAIIASSDLAHTLTDSSPGGFSPQGKKFDQAVVRALRKDSRAKLLELEKQAEEAKACGLRPIVMLIGALNGLNCAPEILSYEGPFGVGYLTARFNFR